MAICFHVNHEVGRADERNVYARHVHDLGDVGDSLFGFHHHHEHDLVVGLLLVVGRCTAGVEAEAHPTHRAHTKWGVVGGLGDVARLLGILHHRHDHAHGTHVQHSVDGA